MRTEPIMLDLKGAAPDVRLLPYLMDNYGEIEPERRRPLVLVLPGGGYLMRSDREAEPIALRLLGLGLSACVLEYSVAPERFPKALLQTLAAIAYVRQHADEWQIDPDKIILMGFSAGGHLAASAGVFWMKPHYAAKIGLKPEDVRPNALALAYPVITSGTATHGGSMENLLGDELYVYGQTVSLELQVSGQVPPTFLWHTWEDQSVPVENALLFAAALRQKGVPFALHIFQRGLHGLSLANDQVYGPQHGTSGRPDCAKWVELFDDWQRQL